MNELALFAGAGGGILGGKLLGWTTVCAVEWEAYPASVLIARQNEGVLPPFPIWDDVRTFDGRPWRGRVDVVSGGFPCQDISAAGKGAGIDGERSGMWAHMARIVREVGPRFVFVENSPMLTSRGLGRVLGDLAAMGYDARWGVLGAVDAGAPHKRDRIWILAHATNDRSGWGEQQPKSGEGSRDVADATGARLQGGTRGGLHGSRGASIQSSCGNQDVAHAIRPEDDGERGTDQCGRHILGWGKQTPLQENRPTRSNGTYGQGEDVSDTNMPHGKGMRCAERSEPQRAVADAPGSWWRQDPAETSKSGVGRMAHGVASRVDRLKATGNGQVPIVAALAWRILSK